MIIMWVFVLGSHLPINYPPSTVIGPVSLDAKAPMRQFTILRRRPRNWFTFRFEASMSGPDYFFDCREKRLNKQKGHLFQYRVDGIALRSKFSFGFFGWEEAVCRVYANSSSPAQVEVSWE